MCSRYDSLLREGLKRFPSLHLPCGKDLDMADPIIIEAWEDDPVAAPLENQPPMNQPVGHVQPNFDPPTSGMDGVR
jgi:hypothetical protein